MRAARLAAAQEGQASVELLALLPLVVLVGVLGWQAVLAGHAWWMAGTAAREAARAQALGHDAKAAAKRALPASLERGLRVDSDGEHADAVRVRVRIPAVAGLRITLPTVTARARMEPQQ
jgi:hypothetical protein